MSYPDPRYFGDTGEPSGVFHRADAEPDLVLGQGGTQVRHLGTGATTNGQFGLYRWDMSDRISTASPHFHRTFSESFFVLSGAIRLYNGESWVTGTSGDFLYVPEGGIHAFANESGEPASMLILFAPGAPRESYFETLAELATSGRKLSEAEWQDLWAQHDQYPAKGL